MKKTVIAIVSSLAILGLFLSKQQGVKNTDYSTPPPSDEEVMQEIQKEREIIEQRKREDAYFDSLIKARQERDSIEQWNSEEWK